MILKKIFSYRSRTYRTSVDGKLYESKKYLIVDINNGSRAGAAFILHRRRRLMMACSM
jgi:hypothetical protein